MHANFSKICNPVFRAKGHAVHVHVVHVHVVHVHVVNQSSLQNILL